MKVYQTTEIPEIPFSDFAVICSPDESRKYDQRAYIIECHSLSEAIDTAEVVLLDFGISVVMDDINKFPCVRSCHMERGSLMKAFLSPLSSQKELINKSLIMRTDEILPSLDAMIENLFTK